VTSPLLAARRRRRRRCNGTDIVYTADAGGETET